MAVTDKRTFNQFDILTASDTNAYLVNDPRPNYVINGGMDFWQRGTNAIGGAGASTTGFLADRFQCYRGSFTAGSAISQGTSIGLTGFQYSLRYQRNAGDTSGQGLNIAHNIETKNSLPLAGQSVTLSFYARVGANFSATGNAFLTQLAQGTGTDQTYTAGFTGQTNVLSVTSTATTSWQRFVFTGTVATTTTQLAIQIVYGPTGTAGANDWIEITGVQLEIGTGASPFRRAGGTIGGEFALCQRYYEKSYEAFTAPGNTAENGAVSFRTYNNTSATLTNARDWRFAVAKRVAPTVHSWSVTAGTGDRITFNGADVTPTIYAVNNNGAALFYTGTTPSNIPIAWHWTAEAEL